MCCIGLSIRRTMMVDHKLRQILNNNNTIEYANLQGVGNAQIQYDDSIAVLLFIAWIKVSFNEM